MTDTITRADTTTTKDATEGTVRIAPAAARECLDVDPTTLIIGDNVRAGAHLDRQFLASLREFGVMDPVHVIRADDGTLTVKRGQRRTLGAVKVGRPTIPVLVVSDDDSEAERITKQWHENERRDALTDTDRLAAVEQLTILGVPAGTIAKRLGTPKKVIDAAVQANTSDLAKAAASKHALTLTDAALIAEFEDNEQVVRDLLSAIKGGFSAEHIGQQARDEKVRQQAYDEAVTALTETGVTVIDRPGHDEKVIQALRDVRLLNKDGSARKKAPTVDEHATCPPARRLRLTGVRRAASHLRVHQPEGEQARPLLVERHHAAQPADRGWDDRGAEGRTANPRGSQPRVGLSRDGQTCVAVRGLPDPHQPAQDSRDVPRRRGRPRRAHRGLPPALPETGWRQPGPPGRRVLERQQQDRGPHRRRHPPPGPDARHSPDRLRVGIDHQPQHLAAPRRAGPPLPDRPHRLGLQALPTSNG